MEELINKFTLERVHKAGAVFDIEKFTWLNEEHLRKKNNEEVLSMLHEELSHSDFRDKSFNDDYLLHIIESMKPRVSFVKEFITKCPYFYTVPAGYDEDVIRKRWKEDTPAQLLKLRDNFAKLDNAVKEDFEQALTKTAEELNIGKGKLIHPVRLAVSGTGTGPGVYDLLFILGKDRSITRINKALEVIKVPTTDAND
jgi:glutamyl-tRNA synthetase